MQNERSPLEALLHRWFVQYNPLYLFSAALVLRGLYGMSGGAPLVVAALTELYAFALIGAAAVLVRRGLPRPAVFAALIAVLYQGDLSLSTEAFAFMGRTGQLGAALWQALFVAKLYLLSRALRLTLSYSALLVPSFGALGIAMIPQLSRMVDARELTRIVAVWLFALAVGALFSSREVTSDRPLDAWGRTVLRRALLATWAIFACLVLGHVGFWIWSFHVDPAIFVPVAMLLAARFVRAELGVLVVVASTLLFVGNAMPRYFQTAAFMSALLFIVHALRRPTYATSALAPPRDDYRARADEELPPSRLVYERAPRAVLVRNLAWATYALGLSSWTLLWSGGEWPGHVLSTDLAVTALIAIYFARSRMPIIVLPLVASYVHWALRARLLQTEMQWGAAAFSLGFLLLVASLFTSVRLSREGLGGARGDDGT